MKRKTKYVVHINYPNPNRGQLLFVFQTTFNNWGSENAFLSSHHLHAWNLTYIVCRLEQKDVALFGFCFFCGIHHKAMCFCIKEQNSSTSSFQKDFGLSQLLYLFQAALLFLLFFSFHFLIIFLILIGVYVY